MRNQAFQKIRDTIYRNQFKLFILLSLVISFALVMVSMSMYSSSGAAQLDLSRPGYISVRSQADATLSNYRDFPISGPIDSALIGEFRQIFKIQSDKVLNSSIFSGDPLSPEALGIGAVF